VWSLLRETASRWSGHKASLLGAAIAYYSVFSHGPLMVIAIAIAGFVFGDDAARGEVSLELKNLLGETGAQAVQAMLAGASRRHNGLVAGMIGVGTLLLAAIWVVVALKEALNTIWDVVAPPSGGVWSLAKSYLASLVGVLALGFLLLVSLLVTTVLAAGAAYITPFVSEAALHAISFLLSFAMVGLLFAMMFKWLPDTDIAWGDVWLGAIDCGDRRQQPIACYRVEDPGLAQQQNQDHGSQPDDDAQVHDGGKPLDADGVDADRNRVRNIELVIGHDTVAPERPPRRAPCR
jgi:membrane protein